jgi:transcriptional regulator with XRE-family HTH domain
MNHTGLPDDDRIDPTIGERHMLARRRCGLSQRELARRVPMSITSLNQFERGKQSLPVERLARLCRLLGVSADYVLGLRPEPQPLTLDDAPPRPGPRPGRRPAPVG